MLQDSEFMDYGYYRGQQLRGSAKAFRKAEFANISIELSNAVDQWKKFVGDPTQPAPSSKKWTAQVTAVEVYIYGQWTPGLEPTIRQCHETYVRGSRTDFCRNNLWMSNFLQVWF